MLMSDPKIMGSCSAHKDPLSRASVSIQRPSCEGLGANELRTLRIRELSREICWSHRRQAVQAPLTHIASHGVRAFFNAQNLTRFDGEAKRFTRQSKTQDASVVPFVKY